jgi:putative ABC transport system permease protein
MAVDTDLRRSHATPQVEVRQLVDRFGHIQVAFAIQTYVHAHSEDQRGDVDRLAAAGVARVPGRSALAAAGLAVAVTGLTVLLAAHASFATSIGDSELAGLVTSTARGTDLVSALLTIVLSAVAVADLTYLSLRERAGELAALAASGWGRAQAWRLLATEAAITAAAGSLAGAMLGLAVAVSAFGLSLPVVAAAAAAAAGGTAVALAATAAVLVLTPARPLAVTLAADE